MNKCIFAAWMLLMLVVTPAWAVKVTTLYEVKIPVASQAADARADAIREGFRDVLMRVTGDQEIEKNKLIRANIERADYYVLEYSYSAPEVSSSTYTLNIKYSEPDVKRLLRKNGIKQWSSIRPLVLVWLATVNAQNNVDILGSESGSTKMEKFMRQGQRIGLPLIFPVMDMADLDKVSPENITEVSLPTIKDASKRYDPDALLIGTIESNDEEGFDGRFSLVLKNKTWDWTNTAESQDKVFAEALEHVSQTLAANKQKSE
jgi:uncharacterized protein